MRQAILLTGGTGSVGRVLSKDLLDAGFSVHILTRNIKKRIKNSDRQDEVPLLKYFYWNMDRDELDLKCFDNVVSIVHLAGESIFGLPWTPSRKFRIKESRIKTIDFLFSKIPSWQRPSIKSLISASAIGIYEANSTHLLRENSPYGNDFLASVCLEWENKIQELAEWNGIREVRFRNGLILESSKGVVPLLNKLSKLYLLSTPGNGKQLVPWIHVKDLVANIIQAIVDSKYQGAYNMVAPEFVDMQQITKKIAELNKRKMLINHVPEKALKILLGEMSCLILDSFWVSPERLLNLGYNFKFPNLELALHDLRKKSN